MKKHFKLILAALSALLLFASSSFAVFAEGGDKLPGGSDDDIKEEDFAYHGSVTGKNSDGTYYTYHFFSDSPICLYRNSKYLTMPSPRGYFKVTSYIYMNTADKSPTLVKGNTFIENSSSTFGDFADFFRSPYYESFTATVPLFENGVDARDYLETGDDSKCINPEYRDFAFDKEWNYSGTIKASDSVVPSVEDRSYSFCSDGRLAILNEEEYVYSLYTGTGSAIYEKDGKKLTKVSADGLLWYSLFPMTRYNSYKSTIPIFTSREKLLNYIETGSYDGCINGNDLVFTGDVGFFLQKVAFHPVADGTGAMYFTWSNEQDYKNAEVEIFGDYSVALGLSKTGIRADLARVPYSDGIYRFTYGDMEKTIVDTGRLEQKFLDKLASTVIQPHYFYLRLIAEDGRISGWVRVSAIPTAGSVSYGVDTGFIDTNGNFVPNNELQDSYTSVPDPWTGKHEYEDDGKEVNGTQSMLDALSKFVDIIGSLIKSMGSVPELVKKVFGFLPNIFFVLIGGSFTVVVILRILGR